MIHNNNIIILHFCDCESSQTIRTISDIVCVNCGICIDTVYDDRKSFQEVSEFSLPILKSDPTLLKYISEYLSSLEIEVNFIDRFFILEQSLYFVKIGKTKRISVVLSIAQILRTDALFLYEKRAPITKKVKKQLEYPNSTQQKTQRETQRLPADNIKKINLIEKFTKRNKSTIAETCKKTNLPLSTFYHMKNYIPKERKLRKITPDITAMINTYHHKKKLSSRKIVQEIYLQKGIKLHHSTITRALK